MYTARSAGPDGIQRSSIHQSGKGQVIMRSATASRPVSAVASLVRFVLVMLAVPAVLAAALASLALLIVAFPWVVLGRLWRRPSARLPARDLFLGRLSPAPDMLPGLGRVD